jgi:hypothetical protein
MLPFVAHLKKIRAITCRTNLTDVFYHFRCLTYLTPFNFYCVLLASFVFLVSLVLLVLTSNKNTNLVGSFYIGYNKLLVIIINS